MILFSTLLISLFISLALIPFFKGLAIKIHAMDIPDDRKVHTRPMPRSGGIAMAVGALIPVLFWGHTNPFILSVLTGAGIIVILGLIDDIWSLGYKVKLGGQLLAALVVIFWGPVKIRHLGLLLSQNVLLPDWISIAITLIAIIGVTNAINLSDGLDGLAGGISLLSFLCIGYLAYQNGFFPVTVLAIAMVGAIFGFLRFNSYPAVIFMGDAGSQLLGFVAITLSIKITQQSSPLSPVLPLLILGFPILDTMTVLLERIAEKRHPLKADKNHFHHKLMRLGLYHTEAVFVIYLLQALLVSAAYVFRYYSEWFLLLFYLFFAGLILFCFQAATRSGWRLKRSGYFDRVIKAKLRDLRAGNLHIYIAFKCVEFGLPLLVLITSLLPEKNPPLLAGLSAGMILLILLTRFVKPQWLAGALRLSIYLAVPFLVYLSEKDLSPWVSEKIKIVYDLSFMGLAFWVIMTLKFTRRTKGFKSSPMDFLILFIALVVPNLPDAQIQSYHLGSIAAKVIVLFFSYEVLIGELRGRLDQLALWTIAALGVFTLKGIIF